MQTNQELQNIALEYFTNKRCFYIPFSELEYDDDYRVLGLIGMQICGVLKELSDVDFGCSLQYNEKKLYIYKKDGDSLTSKFAVEIPYGDRENYISLVIHRKKIFISYCHADKEKVYPIVDAIEESGLNAWIDKKQIDVGENILERVSQGIRECDVSVLFLSEATKTSLFAKHELNTFFNRAIYKTGCKWFLIKLDQVNPVDIYPGLGGYLYYDYYTDPCIDELIIQFERVINK